MVRNVCALFRLEVGSIFVYIHKIVGGSSYLGHNKTQQIGHTKFLG